MPYICGTCLCEWPCGLTAHDGLESLKVWVLEATAWSIACYMFEHERCTEWESCPCACHNHTGLEEPAISVPPSNR